MLEYKIIIDDDGDMNVLNEDGNLVSMGDEIYEYVVFKKALFDIKNKLLEDVSIVESPELTENIDILSKNYFLEKEWLAQLNHLTILRMAIGATREELEVQEELI